MLAAPAPLSKPAFAKIEVGLCWEWTGAIDRKGYGSFYGQRAHRFIWQQLVGQIPEGLVLDHLCRNRRCVNPDHLEPVTTQENTRRGMLGFSNRVGKNAIKTHCKWGHAFTPDNTNVRSDGSRACRSCLQQRRAA